MRNTLSSLTLLAAAFLVPAIAHADTFTLTSVPGGSQPNPLTLTFNLPATPLIAFEYGAGFTVYATVTRNGVADPNDTVNFSIVYPDLGYDGGFFDFDSNLNFMGPQLYTGTAAHPTFLLGTFNLSNESPTGPTDYILTITNGTTTTPEPSSLILLGTAVFGLAGAARRRLQK